MSRGDSSAHEISSLNSSHIARWSAQSVMSRTKPNEVQNWWQRTSMKKYILFQNWKVLCDKLFYIISWSYNLKRGRSILIWSNPMCILHRWSDFEMKGRNEKTSFLCFCVINNRSAINGFLFHKQAYLVTTSWHYASIEGCPNSPVV